MDGQHPAVPTVNNLSPPGGQYRSNTKNEQALTPTTEGRPWYPSALEWAMGLEPAANCHKPSCVGDCSGMDIPAGGILNPGRDSTLPGIRKEDQETGEGRNILLPARDWYPENGWPTD